MKPVWMLGLGAIVLLGGFAVAAPEEDGKKGEVVIFEADEIEIVGGGDWESLPPEAKKKILERLKNELPPEALREALRTLAGKSGQDPVGGKCACPCTCGGKTRARIEKDIIIEVNGERVRPGGGKVHVRRHAFVPPAPPARPGPGHDGALLGAIRALTREITALRNEVRALRATHQKPGWITVPGHPHPFPGLEIEFVPPGKDGEDGKGAGGGKGGKGGRGGGFVIAGDGQPICGGVIAMSPPKPAADENLQKEMRELKAEMAEMKARMAKILKQLEALAAEKR